MNDARDGVLTSRCSRPGRHDGFSRHGVHKAGPAAELWRSASAPVLKQSFNDNSARRCRPPAPVSPRLIRNRTSMEETAVSRKAKRKSGEPPGRRETGTRDGPPTPWAFVLGILLALLSLCLALATVREIYIGLHRDDYVRDELVVSSLSNPSEEHQLLHGQIASTGETVSVRLSSVAGPDFDRFRQLQREGRIKGQRVPVWYLPQETPWWLPGANEFRFIHVSQFEDRYGGWRTAVAITVPLAIVSVFLFLYGLIGGRRGACHPTESGSVNRSYKIRKDEKVDRRMLTACLLFGGAMLGVLAATAWTILSSGGQGGEASGAQSLAVIIALLCVFASVVNVFVAYGKVCWFYRCPSCGKRLTQARNELGPIQYPCDSCGVLWDTGWESGPGD